MAKYTSRDLRNGSVGRYLGVRSYKGALSCLKQGEHLIAHVKYWANEFLYCVDAEEKFEKVERKADAFTLYAVTDKEYLNFLS